MAENSEIASTALTQVKSIIRTLYSNPASHGGATVATVLNDPQLRQDWENELTEMRERIKNASFIRSVIKRIRCRTRFQLYHGTKRYVLFQRLITWNKLIA